MKAVNCNLCERDLEGQPFVDGKTAMGPWAIMCKPCHKQFGCGLGTGKGQEYDAAGKKVAG